MANRGGGNVERLKLASELLGVLDIGEEVNDGNELAVLQPAADEAGVAIAALFTVGDDVHAGVELRLDDLGNRSVGQRLELGFVETAFQAFMQRVQEPRRPWPASDSHDRERSDAG